MFKLVLDTNTLISAFFWEGNEAELLRKIEQRKALLFISPKIIKEIKDVISRPKFKQAILNAKLMPDQIIQKIISISHLIIAPELNINIIKQDPSDNKFIECVMQSNADYIISGDKHLLKLKQYKNIKIIKTSEILKLL